MTMRAAVLCALAAALSGCSLFQDKASQEVDANVRQMELTASESHTFSSLSHIDDALSAYVKDNHRIPESLDLLVPKYLAEIPAVELGIHGYSDKARVTIYPPTVLRDGQVDGMLIKDTGGWGYVYNDHQVVVFVDCTRRDSRGRAWYLERGL